MAKYIDTDALKEEIRKHERFFTTAGDAVVALDVIDGTSAADVEPVRKWILCSEQMPEPYTNVILCRPDADGGMIAEQGYWCGNGWWKVFGTRTMRVTAWMPLPEAPKMDGGNGE